jgi:type IV pilus assembly protein PilE
VTSKSNNHEWYEYMKKREHHDASQHGFTIIELMIVVAVISILASIAIPQYRQYLLKGRVADGLTGLMRAQLKMENYFQDNRVYGTAAGCAFDVTTLDSAFFHYTCTTSSPFQTFTVTATGVNSVAGFQYTVDEAGTKTTVAVGGGWAGAGSACWVTGAGGAC